MSVLWTPLRLVMEEQERKEEAAREERWRESNEYRTDAAVLPLRRQQRVPLQNRITTTAVLEGARGIHSDNGPKMNGVFPNGGDGDHRQGHNQNDSDPKPPKLVVNLNRADKASQIPEPAAIAEPDNEIKKIDEPDGEPEPENNCAIDCLYVTLQCCDCSLM